MPITDNIADIDWQGLRVGLVRLADSSLTVGSIAAWLDRWTQLSSEVQEYGELCRLATMLNTRDTAARQRLREFTDNIEPEFRQHEQQLRSRLLDSKAVPEGMEVPLRRMRAAATLYRSENLPLLARLSELGSEYRALCGNWTIDWQGNELPIAASRRLMESHECREREAAWRLAMQRRRQDREAINRIWREMLELRRQLAANAGQPSYTEYAWLELGRLDYSPADARQFQTSVQSVVCPALARQHAARMATLRIDSLRPWDLTCDEQGRETLRPSVVHVNCPRESGACWGPCTAALAAGSVRCSRQGCLIWTAAAGNPPEAT